MHPQFLKDIENYKDTLISCCNFNEDIFIVELGRTALQFESRTAFVPHPRRYEALMLLGVMEGEIGLSVDYVTHQIPKNGVMWIMPAHISQVINMTPDFKGWILSISKDFLADHMDAPRSNMPLIYLELKKKPFTVFESKEFAVLYESLQTICIRIKQLTHVFHKEVIINAIRSFFLDMGNFFLGKKENVYNPTLTRKEELFADFLKLLSTYCKEHHEVSFYAGKLCITSQYLSLLLKEQSGISASRWIQDAIMAEAKIMLKQPGSNIQEISDKLNFPDQSTFGKFFKKHTKISPAAYRKNN
ncbi:MAG: helix-turn-helix domain-containing protein [Tannerella sp.]|jgi:AraC-like DNA-binding protein|nr:helix-turn-helix domain-containing protein [Tannerella sp.]